MLGERKKEIRWVIDLILVMMYLSALPALAQNELGPIEPNFASYYEPWELHVEPNTASYELPLRLSMLTNYDFMNQKLNLNQVRDSIRQNGFVVIEQHFGDREDIVTPYKYLYDQRIPRFVTADTFLHLYHIQFDETLKEIEEKEFYPDILKLTDALLDDALRLYGQLEGDLEEAARRNIAYLSVAGQLIGSSITIPGIVSDEVASEIDKINAHYGLAPSDIFIYEEDYSQYVPRGHYTRSEILKKYFRTLMWYGRMAFLLKGNEDWCRSCEALISPYDARIQTLQACLLAISLHTQQIEDRSTSEIWNRMYTVTSFYVGLADDLTPYDYIWALDSVFGQEYSLPDLDDPDNFHELRMELALLPSPRIFGGTGNALMVPPITEETLNEILDKTKGMRFTGQRFIPDSYMFENMLYPKVGNYTADLDALPFTCVVTDFGLLRGYPRGLDVMALLGSEQAMDILVQEGDTDYMKYWDKFSELAAEFGALRPEEWNRNLYWGWLYSLQALIKDYKNGYPAFMQSPAWSKRSLNAALASWTELRHDTILYAKQSGWDNPINAYTGPPPPPNCYVEPVPEFFGRLLALTRMTSNGLSDLAALSDQARNRIESLEEMLNKLIEISIKELTNKSLSEQDKLYLDSLAEQLEDLVVGVSDYGLKTTLVADVHTCISEEKVLEEAVGRIDLIVVACPLSYGYTFLAAGPVLSYYEFKHPMEDRLTDEKWRVLLDSPNKPERPTWYRPLMGYTADELPSDIHQKYSGGNGTADDPYLISTAEQMNSIGAEPKDWDKHFKLMADIDLSAYTGTSLNIIRDFAGVFDGNNHIISNFSRNSRSTDYIGLFESVYSRNAEIRDLGLVDPNINGRNYVGSLVGRLTYGRITNCYAESGNISGGNNVGGLIGSNHLGTITGCYVNGSSITGDEHVGGLLGENTQSTTITNCYSNSSVTGTKNVGGLVGENILSATITNCYSRSSVTGTNNIGGLVGNNYGTLRDCYSASSVSGDENVGGFVGFNLGTIFTCYSSGSVLGTINAGGLVGTGGGAYNSYWDTQTSEQTTSAGGIGRTTAEMQMSTTFAGWGCSLVWTIDEGKDYPKLLWENQPGKSIEPKNLFSLLMGSGTETDPFLIYTAEELNTIGLYPCDWDKHFKLMADIDLSDYAGATFNIIGYLMNYSRMPFVGVFDGNCHTISNFSYISIERNYIGLFGYVDGENALIKDLGLIEPNVNAGTGDYVGSLVGYLRDGTITGNFVEGGSVSGDRYVGGLVGAHGVKPGTPQPPPFTISNCYSTSSVSGATAVGGLVGYNNYNGRIMNCYAMGNVSGTTDVGGLVGKNYGNISDSFWDIETSGQSVSDGGMGRTTAEMQTAGTFLEAGWDFIDETENGTKDIWWIDKGQDYPRLWWELSTDDLFFIVVEDFESYNDLDQGQSDSNLIWKTWKDGFDDPITNGSVVDSWTIKYLVERIIPIQNEKSVLNSNDLEFLSQ